MTKFARTAFEEAGTEETPPHSPDSQTWTLTAELLAWMNEHPNDPRVPPVDLLDDRTTWLPEEETWPTTACASEDADTTSTTTTPTADASRSPAHPPAPSPVAPPLHPSAPAAGTDLIPSGEGATCPCGTYHRRYGPRGGGFLCPTCRATALAAR